MIASETIRANQALNDVVREMSFTLSFFARSATLIELMAGQSRRIVVLTEGDVSSETIRVLERSGVQAVGPFVASLR